MAELPEEMGCFILPNHCNGACESCNVTYQSLSASAHADRTDCTVLKAERSTSLSNCLMWFYYWQYVWGFEDRSLIGKGKGSLRQREPQFMQNQAHHTLFPFLRTPPKP